MDFNCTPPAVDDFPSDGLNRDERLQGWIVLHILTAIYIIGALAIVCDDYFVPVMHEFSERLKLPNDISGATFMALGTTCPELFVATIGAFITEGDIGIGAVIGSAIFNVLVIVSVCGIFAGTVVALNWRPLARDCVSYLIAVATLCYIIEDEQIDVYEGCILVIEYLIYIFALFISIKIPSICNGPRQSYDLSEGIVSVIFQSAIVGNYVTHPSVTVIPNASIEKKQTSILNEKQSISNGEITANYDETKTAAFILDAYHNRKIYGMKEKPDGEDAERKASFFSPIFEFPKEGLLAQITWVIWWPVKVLLFFTIPRPSDEQACCLSILTFIISTTYIGILSYLATWMVSVIGYTFYAPDSVMGLTFMALGNCLPEFIASIIVARQSLGNMALSNAMGGNLFALLICLGVPWAAKAAISKKGFVQIHSEGLTYSVVTLFAAVVLMFVIVAINRFRLNKRVGFICLFLYILYVVVFSLYELNVFRIVNLPMCISKLVG